MEHSNICYQQQTHGAEEMEWNRTVLRKWETSILTTKHQWDFFPWASILAIHCFLKNARNRTTASDLTQKNLGTIFKKMHRVLGWCTALLSCKNTSDYWIVVLVLTQESKFLASRSENFAPPENHSLYIEENFQDRFNKNVLCFIHMKVEIFLQLRNGCKKYHYNGKIFKMQQFQDEKWNNGRKFRR